MTASVAALTPPTIASTSPAMQQPVWARRAGEPPFWGFMTDLCGLGEAAAPCQSPLRKKRQR